MTMAYLLQIDFKMKGPFGDEMAKEFSDLAKSINEEDGFIWKIWTENPEKNEIETNKKSSFLVSTMENLSAMQ